MKTQRELNLHYWGHLHDMVDAYNKDHPGADVKLRECVKWRNIHSSDNVFKTYVSDPIFTNRNDENIFAVAILYDEQAGVHRPVFHSDTIYHVPDGERIIIGTGSVIKPNDSKYFSWHKPEQKRTFEINGVDLPCPVKNENAPQRLFVWGETFYFDRVGDDAVWRDAIRSLLKEARDK